MDCFDVKLPEKTFYSKIITAWAAVFHLTREVLGRSDAYFREHLRTWSQRPNLIFGTFKPGKKLKLGGKTAPWNVP